jgi:transcriptional regulator with XRE-family HTH domain
MQMSVTDEVFNLQNMAGTNRLGAFLRALRDRLQPQTFDLAVGVRRRAPGLRREEAAQLCGISPTWYAWIEQGRTCAISVATLQGIASGLRLSPVERAYLFELAQRADPAPEPEAASDPQLLQLLVHAVATPAYILDRHWNALAWNAAAADLFSDWLGSQDAAVADRNLLRYVFLHPRASQLIVDWDHRARRLVAEYRADSAAWPSDAGNQALVKELSDGNAAFAAAWHAQQVLAREGGARSFLHPQRGRCDYLQFTLRVAQYAELKLVILAAAASAGT